MNKLLHILLCILIITFAAGAVNVFAQGTSYYWVGGDGNWNDPTSWSLSSGGPVAGAIPTEKDNVIFDDHSLDPAGTGDYIVTIDGNAKCANVTWIDVPGVNPILVGNENLTFQIYGNLIIEAGITNRFEGVVEFLSAGNTIINAASPFHSKSIIRFNNPAGKWTLQERLSVNTIEIIHGELNANSKTIEVSGNWIIENNADAAFKSSGTVVFNGKGATPQIIRTHTIPGNHEFHYLEINNTGAGVELQSPVTVGANGGGRMIFIDGIVKTDQTNILILNDKTQVSGASDKSHVNGYVRKIGGDGDNEFMFPIGDGSNYRPAGLMFPNPNPNPNTVYVARYINRASTGDTNYPPQNATLPLLVSKYEYWDIVKESNQGADGRILLTWHMPVSGPVGYLGDPLTVSSLIVCSWNSTDPQMGEWTRRNSNDQTVTNPAPAVYSGFLRTQAAVNNSDRRFWTIGMEILPLPIELLYFRAVLVEKTVQLSWATANEVNNEYFTVEKSADGKHFAALVQIAGAGNSHTLKSYSTIDALPHSGLNYYRLKQTDMDGRSVYAKIVVVHTDKAGDLLQVYQPSTGLLQVSYSIQAGEEGILTLYDSRGTQMWAQPVKGTGGVDHKRIPLLSTKGLHLVTLQSASGTAVKKVMVY